ncbi:plasmid mobilization protein [Engelhardtia mirabilis]|uniref:Bacterial mobilization protein (MobC) n=1 Tax=Engelhardtia mirabilis TaxID=2528011 RepID=A0A518BT66_9BACT|nr:Bacterial mobilization protein (MobC) [Planctomycetes bacterium Pla133]QDV04489.1 Bacterial mobilization protein (MobC) [Planctomycetes bacterium Pla86]
MARPAKQPEERRSARAETRLTVAEHEYVRQQARIAGLEVSEYIRRRILGYEVPFGATRRTDPALITELNRLGLELSAIGNNANQLARSSNAGRQARSSWTATASRINALGDQVSAALEALVLRDS